MQNEQALSGLEAGIILIAFVTVAAVFSYSILSTGFFAAEKAESVVHEGTKEASAVLYAEGGIYGYLYESSEPLDGQLKTVQFTVSIPQTGLAQDMRQCLIVYTQYDKEGNIVFNPRTYRFGGSTPSGLLFSVSDGDTDPVMLPGEKRIIMMTDLEGPVPGGYFTIETKPKNGVGAFIKKTLPGAFTGGVII